MNLEITSDELLPVGAIAEVRDVKCSTCNFKNNIWIGLADKDVRSDSERVEEKLKEQLEKEK